MSSTLLNDPTGLGSRVAIHVVRHLFFKCSDDIHASPKCKITPIIRSAFIQSMKKSGKSLDYFLDNILSDPISTAPLLNGARILFEYDLGPDEGLSKRIEKVWNAYTQFLRDNKHFWSAPLRDDEQETAWSIAGILALDTNPVKLLATLLKDIEVAPEGWQYDHQKYLESLPSVAHVLTIGAMATEWLYKHEHKKEGGILFEYIWKYIHGWLRSVSHQVVYSDHIKTAFIQTWARLYLVCGSLSTDKAKSEIIRLDHLDLMLEAANNFQKNQNISSGSLKLDPQLQHIIRQRFVEMFNIFRLYRNITPENAENYRKIMKELTPDIDESEVN